MAYFVLSGIFFTAFLVETVVTGVLFSRRSNLNISAFMRWWAILSLVSISSLNLLGYMRLRQNHIIGTIDAGNYVQAAFAAAALSLFGWVWVFHVRAGKWGI